MTISAAFYILAFFILFLFLLDAITYGQIWKDLSEFFSLIRDCWAARAEVVKLFGDIPDLRSPTREQLHQIDRISQKYNVVFGMRVSPGLYFGPNGYYRSKSLIPTCRRYDKYS
jgi:hypothetical protein